MKKKSVVAVITITIILFIQHKNFSFEFIPAATKSDLSTHEIYLINQSWHTGILIPVNNTTKELFPVLKLFEGKNYVDIGWGDEEFYQHPDFDLYLAAKAILYPTRSVLRIEGHISSIESIINWSEYIIKFKLNDDGLKGIANFINKTFQYDSNGNFIITSHRAEGSIIFFRSKFMYHLFNTCNTWAAEVLNAAGFKIDFLGIITAEQLFSKVKKFGEVLKEEE